MELNVTSCCALTELYGISESPNGLENLSSYCHELWGNPDQYGKSNPDDDPWGGRDPSWMKDSAPDAFVVFTAHVGTLGKGLFKTNLYGHNFAQTIKQMKLGSIIESRAHANRVNNPDHLVKVWVWHPNEKKLRAFWFGEAGKKARKEFNF